MLTARAVSGLFGMNNTDLPADAEWAWILGYTGVGCVVLFLIVYLIYCCSGPSRALRQQYDRELSQLHQLTAETGVVTAYVHEPGTTHGQLFVAKGSTQFGAISYSPTKHHSLINWAKLRLVQYQAHKMQRAERTIPLESVVI